MPGLLLAAACLLAAGSAAGEALAPEVRVFEIRRTNSDFSPLSGLSFRVESDGAGVALSNWLATLARRIPDAYLAQLLTLRPEASGDGWETARLRGRRTLRVRIAERGDGERFAAELALDLAGSPVWEATARGAIQPGTTLIATGREFELPVSRYLSWFREADERETRSALYARLRDQTIFLALGITFRARENPAAGVALDAPDDPRLLDLGSSLIGAAAGSVRLRVELDADGLPGHIEVVETTFPEVTPRVLGIVSGWRFPEAAGASGRLSFRVASGR